MFRIAKIFAGFLIGLLGLGIVVVWLILSTAMFSDFRRSVVETALSAQIGQSLVVKDDVRIDLGRTPLVYVSGVEIPSENIESTNLAELNLLELEVNVVSLMQGVLGIDNLKIDGLQVNMITQQDGATSWTPSDGFGAKPVETSDATADGIETTDQVGKGGIFDFLSDKTVSFTNIGLTIDNKTSGFVFVFDLGNLSLEQLEGGQLVSVISKGTINGEPFSIDGKYPRGKAFTTKASFGELRLDFDGEPLNDDPLGGFRGLLTLDTGEFGEVLDILGLERVLEGNGHLSAGLTNQAGMLKVEGLQTNIALAEGQLITIDGDVENLLNATGIDIEVDARLYPEGNPPDRAEKLKDLKLTGFGAHIISHEMAVEFENLELTTNAFDQNLNQIGPVSIGRIMRSENGELSLLNVSLQAGPLVDPYVIAHGNFKDVLQLKGLEFEGKLTAPASVVLHKLREDQSAAFGRVTADFSVTDATGYISLTNLHAYTEGTDLWSLEVQSALENVNVLDGLNFSLDLDVPDGAEFLTALGLEPVEVGALEITATAQGGEKVYTTTASILAGGSRLSATLDARKVEDNSIVRGLIASKLLNIDDLKNAIGWALEISSLATPDGVGVRKDDKKEEPLVLANKSEPTPPTDGKREEPLVLNKADVSEGKPTDLVDAAQALAKLDLEFGIDIEKIVGQQGVSSVSSDFAIKDAKARVGPIEVNYGGGFFSLSAAMDLAQSPELLNVSGATSGWDLDTILETAGLGIDAHGKLRGQFNVTGNRASAKTFVNSMYGSATVSMSGGTIATSLLELAGLGIFPWLFSAELKQGYTDIVCVVAPVRIQSGKVAATSIVAETASVQMVVAGNVDWINDTIALRAEPRPVGRPLARSAWPIDITGALSEPNFKLNIGGSRSKRADGATDMQSKRRPCKPDIRQLE
jgi:AsmA family protein